MAASSTFLKLCEPMNTSPFFAGCDGGDPGSPASPSVWLFGLEPGWSQRDQERTSPLNPDYTISSQLKWPYNQAAFQLLAAMDGLSARDYENFAKAKRPFERGCTGYFKGNLYPLARSNNKRWEKQNQEDSGFETLKDYEEGVAAHRIPRLRAWMEEKRPRILIGVGLGHAPAFKALFAADPKTVALQEHCFQVNDHLKRVLYSTETFVPFVLLPHFTGGSHGLNSYEARQKAGIFIREKILGS